MGVFGGALVSWLVSTYVLAALQSHGACEKAKSKIVFMTIPIANSPYFNSLELAEQMASRGHEVCYFRPCLV